MWGPQYRQGGLYKGPEERPSWHTPAAIRPAAGAEGMRGKDIARNGFHSY